MIAFEVYQNPLWQNMTVHEKLIHHYLANRAYRKGVTWVSVGVMAVELGMNRKTIIASTATLDRLGFVKKDSSNRRNTVYKMNRESVPPDGTNQSVPPHGINTVPDPLSVPPHGTQSKEEVKKGILIMPNASTHVMKNHPQNIRGHKVSDKIREWAKTKGYPNPDELIEDFKLYHISKGTQFDNIDAAFVRWIQKAASMEAKDRASVGAYPL